MTKEEILLRTDYNNYVKVRCEIEDFGEIQGFVVPEKNNPWIAINSRYKNQKIMAERQVSWSYLLDILNDPQTSPHWFWKQQVRFVDV